MRALGLWMLLGALGAHAAESPSAPLTQGWADATAAQARAQLEGLRQLGLADAVSLDRVEEWKLKGATPERIVELLTAWRAVVSDAAVALRRAGQPMDSVRLEAAAEARLAGFTPEQLTPALRGADSAREATARCLALSTLALSGFSPSGVSEAMAAALASGYRGGDFEVLVHSAQRLSRENVAPRPVLLDEATRAMRQQVRAADLYPAVLRAVSGGTLHPRNLTPESGFNHPVFRKTVHP